MPYADNYTSDFERSNAATSGDSSSKASSARAILRFVQRRLVLILACAIGFTVIAGVFGMVVKPRYVGQAVVMLGVNHDNMAQTNPALTQDVPVSPEIVRSELDVIQSRTVTDMVIKKLNLANDPEFNPTNGSFLAKLKAKNLSPEDQAKRRSDAIEEKVLGNLKADNDGRSFGIHVSFTSHDPNKAALIANTFAEQYLAHQLAVKTQLTQNASQWLESRMAGLKDKVTESEQAAADFRANNHLITVGDGAAIDRQTLASQQLGELNSQLVEAKANTYQAEARLRAAQTSSGATGAGGAATEILASPLIQTLRGQEATLQSTEADLLSRYGPLHPKVISVQAQKRDLEAKIADETQKIMGGLSAEVYAARAKQSAIQATINGLVGRVSTEADQKVTLDELDRQADTNRQLYEAFLLRSSQVAEQTTLQVPDATIVAVAKPPLVAAFPKKKILLIAGLILGTIVGFLVAYMIEFLDPTFRSLEQVERSTNLHVIGLVPDVRTLTKLSPENYIVGKPGSQFAESLRSAWADITSHYKGGAIRTLAVTSATQGEGKTTLSLSLARMLALGGHRILLVDGDMRRSKIGPALGMAAKAGGLAALLAGEKTLAEVAQVDPSVKSLTLLLSDGAILNAQELLSSDRLAEFIAAAAEQFDLVIFDTPPAGAVSDAAVISRLADVTVFVTQWAKVPETEVNRAIRQFKSAGGRISGVALSQVKVNEYRKYVDGYNPDLYSAYFVN